MTSNPYTAPEDEPAPKSRSGWALAGLILCTTLGAAGLFMTCYSGVSVAAAQSGLLAANAEQAAILAEAQAQQPFWVLPFTVLQLVAKLLFSAALVLGGALAMAGKSIGGTLLKPTLVFGILFEPGAILVGVLSMALQWEQMQSQFTRSIAADPNIQPDMVQMMGSIFMVSLLVVMAGMGLWALVKAAIYALTLRSLFR